MTLSGLLTEIEAKTTRTPRWEDPNYLADLLLELGSYYATLGSHVAEAEQAASLSESHYKYTRERFKLDYVKTGESATVADSRARVETREHEEDAISLKYKANLLKFSRDGLSTTIDVIRSKLSFLKTEKENPQ